MHATLDQFLGGFERSAENLGEVLDRWYTTAEDLREHWADELAWMLSMQRSVQHEHQGRATEIAARLSRANAKITASAVRVERLMGIRINEILADAGSVYPIG